MLSKRSFGLSLPCYVLRGLSTPRRNCICIEEMRINPSEISCLSQLQEIIKTFRAKLCMYTFRYLPVNRVKLGRKLNPPRDFNAINIPCSLSNCRMARRHFSRPATGTWMQIAFVAFTIRISLHSRLPAVLYTAKKKKKEKRNCHPIRMSSRWGL